MIMESLGTEQRRLATVLDAIPAYVYLQAPDGSIRLANRALRDHFGEPEGRRCYDFLYNRQAPCEECQTFRVFDTQTPQMWEKHRPDGLIYQFHDYPFTDIDGSPLVLKLCFDITERKQTEQALLRRAEELETLVTFSSTLRQMQTREAMLPLLVDQAMAALRADAGTLMLLEDNALVFAAARGPTEALLEQRQLPADDPLWDVLHTGIPLYSPDLAQQSDFSLRSICCRYTAFGACALIPLKTTEATIGLLHLAFQSPHAFPKEERRLLTALAEIAGNALHRASLMDTLEQQVADRTRALSTLYAVTSVASESLDLKTVLEQSLERVLAAIQSQVGAIHLVDEDGKTLHLAVQGGLPPGIVTEINSSPWGGGLPGWVVAQGQPLVVPHLGADPRAPQALRKKGPCAYVGVPIRTRGRVSGVLSVIGQAGQPFSAEEVALLASIGDQVGVAVENARLRQRAEQAAVLEERARLARELHDSVTQSLYSLTLYAEAGRRLAATGELERVSDYLVRLGDTAQQALKEMRLLVHELRPPILVREGLVRALQYRLDAVERRASVEACLLVDGPVELPAPVEEGLYYIAREALNNALKHAGANSVKVHIRVAGERVELEVVDNGRGFDPDLVSDLGGMGLMTMRERAERLGGKLTVESEPGEGTRVKVNVKRQT